MTWQNRRLAQQANHIGNA